MTPNHALQRTATLAFSYRRAAVSSTGSVTACAPAMKPGTCRAFASRRCAHTRSLRSRSLNLGSLGVIRVIKMKLTASFALGFVIMLTACDRIEHARVDRDYRLFSRREQAFSEDMAHMANAKDTIYRLDYVLSDDWLRSFSSDSHSFRAMPGGRFDMLPWLQSAGLARTENTSAVFDLFKHTVTVIGPGPSAALIARLIEPLRPDKCASIAPKK